MKTPKGATTLIHYILLLGSEDAAIAWSELNRWNWPDVVFPLQYKPVWWDGVSGITKREIKQRKHGFISAVRPLLESLTTKAEINKAWQALLQNQKQ